MNKQEILNALVKNVKSKHPWKISQEKYEALFQELPLEFLEERLVYDNLLVKQASFKKCHLILSDVKIEVQLTLDELIAWELSLDKWEEARAHNIVSNDIKKILKEQNV
jgi:hypothetical protein